MDAFLAQALGTVDRVVLPELGSWVDKGDRLLEVFVGGRALTVVSPVDGEIQRVNEDLHLRPDALTDNPYGAGWAVTVWSRNHRQAIRPLMIGPPAVSYLLREVRRLAEFLPGEAGPAPAPLLADGGLPRRGCLTFLDDAKWARFQAEFLSPDARTRPVE